MRKLGVVLVLLICLNYLTAWAKEDTAQTLQTMLVYLLRVAEVPCPKQLRPEFPEATCYRHGYANFFDFKEAIGMYLEPNSFVKSWRVVTLGLGKYSGEAFRADYRPEGSKRQLTFVYVSDGLLLLATKDLNPSP